MVGCAQATVDADADADIGKTTYLPPQCGLRHKLAWEKREKSLTFVCLLTLSITGICEHSL